MNEWGASFQRILKLCRRDVGYTHVNFMIEVPLREEASKPTIQFFREYGVYEAPGSFIVSVPDWKTALETVDTKDFGSSVVLLPELITIAGRELRHVGEYRDDIEKSLEDFAETSRAKPQTTFVLGSPHYVGSDQSPYNAAFVFKDGKIINIFHKRLNASEVPHLSMDPEAATATVNGANFLICKDFMGASFENDLAAKMLLLQQANKIEEDEALKLASVPYIDPSLDTLFVISCWGVGMWLRDNQPKTEDEINQYYQRSLETVIRYAFMANANLRQIVMSDRTPSSARFMKSSQAATKPLSFIATRK